MVTQTAAPKAPARANGVPDLRDLDLDTLTKLYPPREGGMPASLEHQDYFIKIVDALSRWFSDSEREVSVIGDWFIYYLDEFGERRSVGPDVAVIFGVDLSPTRQVGSYFIELMDKPPSFIMEIASPKTAFNDLYEKPRIYARMGVDEYWQTDPTGGRHYRFPLRGLRLVDGEYVEIELEKLPNGGLRGHSQVLGLDFVWANNELRIIDPETGERLRWPAELEAEARAAHRARRAAEIQAGRANARAERAEAELAELRRRLRDR